MSATATITEPVTYEELVSFEGRVRVAFENRSAWNGELVHDAEGSLLRWVDFKKGPARDRDFLLGQDDDGFAICETKPAWGRLTVVKAR